MHIAILVPAADYAAEWRWAFGPQAATLEEAGLQVSPVAWTSDHRFDEFDLIMPLVAWGYHQNQIEWLQLLDRLEADGPPVANPVPLLRWNSDKAYLAELGSAGVATVPSVTAERLDDAALHDARERFATADLVIKPLVSASAYGTFRLGAADAVPEAVRGWRMLIQPWLCRIVDEGEYSLIFFDGRFSHAVRKVPQVGEFRVQPEFGGIITRCEPPEGSIDLARNALAQAPAPSTYARVDLIPGNDGGLQVMELELIEPALFLAQAPEAGRRFAQAVISAAERAREQPLSQGRSQVRR